MEACIHFPDCLNFNFVFGKPEHSADVVELSSRTLEETYMWLLYILKR